MQTEDSQKVIKRFFEALRYLKDEKIIRGKQTFTRAHEINRWNMNTLEKDPSRDIFQAAWLTYLVNDYGVSATWLLTGRGDILLYKKDKSGTEGKKYPFVPLYVIYPRQAFQSGEGVLSVCLKQPPVCSCQEPWRISELCSVHDVPTILRLCKCPFRGQAS